jgi:hypothetical protein
MLQRGFLHDSDYLPALLKVKPRNQFQRLIKGRLLKAMPTTVTADRILKLNQGLRKGISGGKRPLPSKNWKWWTVLLRQILRRLRMRIPVPALLMIAK